MFMQLSIEYAYNVFIYYPGVTPEFKKRKMVAMINLLRKE